MKEILDAGREPRLQPSRPIGMNNLVGRSAISTLGCSLEGLTGSVKIPRIDSRKHPANFRLDLGLGNAVAVPFVDVLPETLLRTGRIWHVSFFECSGT